MDSSYLAGAPPVHRKCLAAVLAVVVFLTNGLFAYASESNFWTDRRRAQASLPTADLSLPSVVPVVTRGLSASARRLLPPNAPRPLVDLIASLPADLVTVRKVSAPSNGASVGPLVLHVQDVHQNLEAQRNIGRLVESLGTTPKLIALEGAFGPMDLAPFRRPEYSREMRLAADYMFHEGLLTGSVYAGLIHAGDIPPFVGVDDAAHYRANVEAYRSSAPRQAEMKNRLSETAKTLEARKAAAFNPELLEFDATITAYRSGKLSLGEYARRLTRGREPRATDAITRAWHGLPAHAHGSLYLFLGALALEESLDFKRVEAERARLIESLVHRLSKNELDDLLARSAAYRAGRIQYGEFYGYLRDLAGGELLTRFPAMDAYVRYVLLADAIDSEKLFEELKSFEETACLRLARTEEEKQLLAESRLLFLMRKLADFTLTPEEWKEYENGMSKGVPPVPREGMASFESFYREADARDAAMSGNLLPLLEKERAGVRIPVVLLITGGYHSRGMDERLTRAGCTVVSVTPKLTKMDTKNGSAYLSIFAQEKTPLDKLVEGDKLFLSRLQLTADAKEVRELALLTAGQNPEKAPAAYQAISGDGRPVEAKAEGNHCRVAVKVQDGEAGEEFDAFPDRIKNAKPFFIPKAAALVFLAGLAPLALKHLSLIKGGSVLLSQQVLASPLAGTLFAAAVVFLAVLFFPAVIRRELMRVVSTLADRGKWRPVTVFTWTVKHALPGGGGWEETRELKISVPTVFMSRKHGKGGGGKSGKSRPAAGRPARAEPAPPPRGPSRRTLLLGGGSAALLGIGFLAGIRARRKKDIPPSVALEVEEGYFPVRTAHRFREDFLPYVNDLKTAIEAAARDGKKIVFILESVPGMPDRTPQQAAQIVSTPEGERNTRRWLVNIQEPTRKMHDNLVNRLVEGKDVTPHDTGGDFSLEVLRLISWARTQGYGAALELEGPVNYEAWKKSLTGDVLIRDAASRYEEGDADSVVEEMEEGFRSFRESYRLRDDDYGRKIAAVRAPGNVFVVDIRGASHRDFGSPEVNRRARERLARHLEFQWNTSYGMGLAEFPSPPSGSPTLDRKRLLAGQYAGLMLVRALQIRSPRTPFLGILKWVHDILENVSMDEFRELSRHMAEEIRRDPDIRKSNTRKSDVVYRWLDGRGRIPAETKKMFRIPSPPPGASAYWKARFGITSLTTIGWIELGISAAMAAAGGIVVWLVLHHLGWDVSPETWGKVKYAAVMFATVAVPPTAWLLYMHAKHGVLMPGGIVAPKGEHVLGATFTGSVGIILGALVLAVALPFHLPVWVAVLALGPPLSHPIINRLREGKPAGIFREPILQMPKSQAGNAPEIAVVRNEVPEPKGAHHGDVQGVVGQQLMPRSQFLGGFEPGRSHADHSQMLQLDHRRNVPVRFGRAGQNTGAVLEKAEGASGVSRVAFAHGLGDQKTMANLGHHDRGRDGVEIPGRDAGKQAGAVGIPGQEVLEKNVGVDENGLAGGDFRQKGRLLAQGRIVNNDLGELGGDAKRSGRPEDGVVLGRTDDQRHAGVTSERQFAEGTEDSVLINGLKRVGHAPSITSLPAASNGMEGQGGRRTSVSGWIALLLSAGAAEMDIFRLKRTPHPSTWGLWERALTAFGMDRARARWWALRYGGRMGETVLTLLLFVGLTAFLEWAGFGHRGSVGGAALASQLFFSLMHLTGIYRWNEALGGYEPVPMFGARAPPMAERLKILLVYFLKSLLWHVPYYALLAFAPMMTQSPFWAFLLTGAWAMWTHGFPGERTPFRGTVHIPNPGGRIPAETSRLLDGGNGHEFTLTDEEGSWVVRKSGEDLKRAGTAGIQAGFSDLEISRRFARKFATRTLGLPPATEVTETVEETVPISRIHVIHGEIPNPGSVLNLLAAPLDLRAHPIYAVRLSDGRYLLVEGNHRLVAARLNGMEAVPLQVLRFKDARVQTTFETNVSNSYGPFFTVDDKVGSVAAWFKKTGTKTAGPGASMSQTLPPGASAYWKKEGRSLTRIGWIEWGISGGMAIAGLLLAAGVLHVLGWDASPEFLLRLPYARAVFLAAAVPPTLWLYYMHKKHGVLRSDGSTAPKGERVLAATFTASVGIWLGALVVAGVLAYHLSPLIALAGLLPPLLHPLINWLKEREHVERGAIEAAPTTGPPAPRVAAETILALRGLIVRRAGPGDDAATLKLAGEILPEWGPLLKDALDNDDGPRLKFWGLLLGKVAQGRRPVASLDISETLITTVSSQESHFNSGVADALGEALADDTVYFTTADPRESAEKNLQSLLQEHKTLSPDQRLHIRLLTQSDKGRTLRAADADLELEEYFVHVGDGFSEGGNDAAALRVAEIGVHVGPREGKIFPKTTRGHELVVSKKLNTDGAAADYIRIIRAVRLLGARAPEAPAGRLRKASRLLSRLVNNPRTKAVGGVLTAALMAGAVLVLLWEPRLLGTYASLALGGWGIVVGVALGQRLENIIVARRGPSLSGWPRRLVAFLPIVMVWLAIVVIHLSSFGPTMDWKTVLLFANGVFTAGVVATLEESQIRWTNIVRIFRSPQRRNSVFRWMAAMAPFTYYLFVLYIGHAMATPLLPAENSAVGVLVRTVIDLGFFSIFGNLLMLFSFKGLIDERRTLGGMWRLKGRELPPYFMENYRKLLWINNLIWVIFIPIGWALEGAFGVGDKMVITLFYQIVAMPISAYIFASQRKKPKAPPSRAGPAAPAIPPATGIHPSEETLASERIGISAGPSLPLEDASTAAPSAEKQVFRRVNPYKDVDFSKETTDAPWLKPAGFWAKKVEPVRARRAKPGEQARTVARGWQTAAAGDWKVTTSRGDSYFLNDAKFRSRYRNEQTGSGLYEPTAWPVRMFEITEPVEFTRRDGLVHRAPAGSVLVKLDEDDVYAVHRDNFQRSFVRTDEFGRPPGAAPERIPPAPFAPRGSSPALGEPSPGVVYREVDPKAVGFSRDVPGVDWLGSRFFWGKKVEGVRAVPAVKGESVMTAVNGTEVADTDGLMKITTSRGDQYFLPMSTFRRRYDARQDSRGVYRPAGWPVRMAEITRNVRFMAPWGKEEFLPAGSVLVNWDGEVYGIHRDNFHASYARTDDDGHLLIADRAALDAALKPENRAAKRRAVVEIGGREEFVDLQVPPGLDLSAPVNRVTFVLDLDDTLTLSGASGRINPQVLEQMVRAFELRNRIPGLRIHFRFISRNNFGRDMESRFVHPVPSSLPEGESSAGVHTAEGALHLARARLRSEGRNPSRVGIIPRSGESVLERVFEPLRVALAEKGLEAALSDEEILTRSGEEKAVFNPVSHGFELEKDRDRVFGEAEQLAVAKTLCDVYLESLGEKRTRDFRAARRRIEDARSFLGEGGVMDVFMEAVKDLGVRLSPTDGQVKIICKNPEASVDGLQLLQEGMDRLREQGVLPADRIYFVEADEREMAVSLFDKADEVRRLTGPDEIVVCAGNGPRDTFLFDPPNDLALPIFLGPEETAALYPRVVAARDEEGRSDVRSRGTADLLRNILDVAERGGTWGEVKFLNNRFSPDEVRAGLPDVSREAGSPAALSPGAGRLPSPAAAEAAGAHLTPPVLTAMEGWEPPRVLAWVLDHLDALPETGPPALMDMADLARAVQEPLERLGELVGADIRQPVRFTLRRYFADDLPEGRLTGPTLLAAHSRGDKVIHPVTVQAKRDILNGLFRPGTPPGAQRAFLSLFNYQLERNHWTPRLRKFLGAGVWRLEKVEDYSSLTFPVYKALFRGPGGQTREIFIKQDGPSRGLRNEPVYLTLENLFLSGPRRPVPMYFDGDETSPGGILCPVYHGAPLRSAAERVRRSSPALQTEFIRRLGEHAALGDVFGRDDRNLGNTCVELSGGRLGSITDFDVSRLLDGADSYQWSLEEIGGGLGEINWVRYFGRGDGRARRELLTVFLKAYVAAWRRIQEGKESAKRLIEAKYPHAQAARMNDLLDFRLNQDIRRNVFDLLLAFLDDYAVRTAYRDVFHEILDRDVSLAEKEGLSNYFPRGGIEDQVHPFRPALSDDFIDRHPASSPKHPRLSELFRKIDGLTERVLGADRRRGLQKEAQDIHARAYRDAASIMGDVFGKESPAGGNMSATSVHGLAAVAEALDAPEAEGGVLFLEIDDTLITRADYEFPGSRLVPVRNWVLRLSHGMDLSDPKTMDWANGISGKEQEEAERLTLDLGYFRKVPGVDDLFRAARRRGLRVVLISNRAVDKGPSTLELLRQLGFDIDSQDLVLCGHGQGVKARKVLATLRGIESDGRGPRRAYFVDDDPGNVETVRDILSPTHAGAAFRLDGTLFTRHVEDYLNAARRIERRSVWSDSDLRQWDLVAMNAVLKIADLDAEEERDGILRRVGELLDIMREKGVTRDAFRGRIFIHRYLYDLLYAVLRVYLSSPKKSPKWEASFLALYEGLEGKRPSSIEEALSLFRPVAIPAGSPQGATEVGHGTTRPGGISFALWRLSIWLGVSSATWEEHQRAPVRPENLTVQVIGVIGLAIVGMASLLAGNAWSVHDMVRWVNMAAWVLAFLVPHLMDAFGSRAPPVSPVNLASAILLTFIHSLAGWLPLDGPAYYVLVVVLPYFTHWGLNRIANFEESPLALTPEGMLVHIPEEAKTPGLRRDSDAAGAESGTSSKQAILEREGLSGYPALVNLLTPEDIKVLEEYPMLRPVFMVRFSEERGEVGPLQVTGERHVRALGRAILEDRGDVSVEDENLQLKTGREAMDRLTGFGAGPLQTADRLAREDVPMFAAFTDKVSEGTFKFRVANGRRVYVREGNLWLSMKGGGQNNRPDEAPWFVAHSSKGDIRYEGLTFDRGPDADQMARMEASDGSFTPSLAWRTLNVIENQEGQQVPVAGIAELQAEGPPFLTFEIVSPLRLNKMPQMRESDPRFEKWLARFRADQRRRGLPEPENVADMLTMIVERIAITTAAKQNLGLGKRSAVTLQDYDEFGFESDKDEIIPLKEVAELPALKGEFPEELLKGITTGAPFNVCDLLNFDEYFLYWVSYWLEHDKGELDIPISNLPPEELLRRFKENPDGLDDMRLRLLKTFFQTYFQHLNPESLEVLTQPVGRTRGDRWWNSHAGVEWSPGAYLANIGELGFLLGPEGTFGWVRRKGGYEPKRFIPEYDEAVGNYIQELLRREIDRRNNVPHAGTAPSVAFLKTVAARTSPIDEFGRPVFQMFIQAVQRRFDVQVREMPNGRVYVRGRFVPEPVLNDVLKAIVFISESSYFELEQIKEEGIDWFMGRYESLSDRRPESASGVAEIPVAGPGMIPAVAGARLAGLMRRLKGRIGAMNVARLYRWALVSPFESGFGLRGKEGISLWGILTRGDLPVVVGAWLTSTAGGNTALVTAAFVAFFAAVRIPFILAHPKGLRWGAAMASVTGLLLFLTMFFGFHLPAAGAAVMGLVGHSLWNLLADALRPAAVVNREYLDMAVRLGRRDPESAAEIFEKILGQVDRLDLNSLNGKVSAKPGPLDPSPLDPAGTRIVVLNALSVDTPEELEWLERVVKAMARPGVVFSSDKQSVVDLVASKLTNHPGVEAKRAGDRLFENGSLHLDALNGVLPPGADSVEVVAPKDCGPVIREDDTDPRLSRAEVKPLESLLRLIEYLGILNAFIERQA